LRNRLHPANERAVLHERRPVPNDHPEHRDFAGCASMEPETSRFLGVESRIPVGHKLSRFFSPHLPSLDAARYSGLPGASRLNVLPDMYPDPRPTVAPRSAQVTPGDFPASRGQGSFPCFARFGSGPVAPLSPREREVCQGPREAWPEFLQLHFLSTCPSGQVPLSAKLIEGFEQRFARIVTRSPNERFIPRTTRFTHAQTSSPSEGWAPCLFEAPPSTRNASRGVSCDDRRRSRQSAPLPQLDASPLVAIPRPGVL
jgi:hypothetical protein